MFDGGLFILLVGVGLLFAMPRLGIHFKLMSVFIFFALGTVLLSGMDVGFVTQSVSSTTGTTVESFYLIGDSDASTFNENSQWVGWIFIATGALVSFSFLSNYIGGRY
jgi:hypothetical protein